MELNEFRNKLVDLTGKIWLEGDLDKRGWVFDWIHPDAPFGNQLDGVQIVWAGADSLVEVYSEDNELMFTQKLEELDQRLTIAVGYAQMAGGLTKNYPELINLPTMQSCTQATEALFLANDLDPAFFGSSDGVGWWTEQGYVAEYDSNKQAFIIWYEGSYWIAGTPQGYVEALKKAEADIEKMLFHKLKSEVSEK